MMPWTNSNVAELGGRVFRFIAMVFVCLCSLNAAAQYHEPSLNDLIANLGKDGHRFAWSTGRTISINFGDTAVPPLLAAMSGRDDNMRAGACAALGEVGDKRAVEPLISQLSHPNSEVRASAAW